MNDKEWLSVCKTLSAFYPQTKNFETADSVNLWYQVLKDIEYEVMQRAVVSWVKNETRIPTVADLREYARRVQAPEVSDWGKAWEHVLVLMSRYGYYRQQDAFNEMTQTEQETVTMIGYKNLCHSNNLQTDRASFRDIYNRLAERHKEKARITTGAYIPEKPRTMIETTEDKTVKTVATEEEINRALARLKEYQLEQKA